MKAGILMMALAAALLPVTPLPAAVPSSQLITAPSVTQPLTTRYGTRFDVYAAGAVDARDAVLILPGLMGVTPAIRTWADELGQWGYRVLALDLYDGRSLRSPALASEVRRAIDPQWMQADVQAALDVLSADGRRYAILAWDVDAGLLSELPQLGVAQPAGALLFGGPAPDGLTVPVRTLGIPSYDRPTRHAVAEFLSQIMPGGAAPDTQVPAADP